MTPHRTGLGLIEQVRAIAEESHSGQVNAKNGEPYIRHVERVAGYTRLTSLWLGLSEVEAYHAEAVAWLHDTVEDTDLRLEDLSHLPEPVVAGVGHLTRTGKTSEHYYQAILTSRISLAVKWADILDNTHPARLAVLPKEVRTRLIRKYEEGAACLSLSPTPHQWWKSQIASPASQNSLS